MNVIENFIDSYKGSIVLWDALTCNAISNYGELLQNTKKHSFYIAVCNRMRRKLKKIGSTQQDLYFKLLENHCNRPFNNFEKRAHIYDLLKDKFTYQNTQKS